MHTESEPEAMGTNELVKELAADSALLVKRQLELATLEIKNELKQRVGILETFGVSGLMAFAGILMLLVAAASALGSALGRGLWAGALIIAAILSAPAAIVGAIGYRKMESRESFFKRSRRELDKEIEFSRTLTT